jgi:hypothetical protein
MTDQMQLKRSLFDLVGAALAKHGFKLKAAKESFVRQHDGETDIFQLVCLDGKPGWRIQPNVGVRIERVEAIFHETSGFEPRYQNDTPTIGSAVGNITAGDNRACEFLLEDSCGLSSVAENIVDVFERIGLPYFDRFSSISAIDRELNSDPTKRTPNRVLPWLRCSTGVIVAKLSGRADYGKLVEIYLDALRKSDKGFYLKRFEALLRSLESVHAEVG